MACLGVKADHIAIRTSSYTGVAERGRQIKVHGLTYLIKRLFRVRGFFYSPCLRHVT